MITEFTILLCNLVEDATRFSSFSCYHDQPLTFLLNLCIYNCMHNGSIMA